MVKRTPTSRTRSRGVAMIEVIVAAVVLGLAVSAMLGLAGRALSSQSEGERLEMAARLADERLNLVLAVGCEGYTAAFPLAGACDEPFAEYRFDVTIDSATGGLASSVRATISWPQAGRLRALSLDTLIAPRRGDDPDPDRKPQETIAREAL